MAGLRFLTADVQKAISRYIVNTGDVIISIAGSIGLTAEVTEQLDGVNLTENAAKLVAKADGQYAPGYLAQAIRSDAVQRQISGHIGQVTIGKLALFRIEKLEIPVPPIELQAKYVKTVCGLDGVRERLNGAVAAFDALFSSLQSRAFRGEL
jgi:restriction endonuclease S subunit